MYRGRTFQRETAYVAGDFIDGDIYPVFQPPGKRRKKCRPTSAIQKRINQRNAEKKLARLIHANFSERDLVLHLTYRAEDLPADEEAAKKDVRNYLRRVKRVYKKAGIELRYIYITERGAKSGRVHHHLILSGGVDRDELERMWGRGYANSHRLQLEDEGAAPLAKYITKQRKEEGERVTYRRWTGSRNLAQPELIQHDGELTAEDVLDAAEAVEEGRGEAWLEARFPGYRCVRISAERNVINRGVYMRYTLRLRPASLGSQSRGRG